MRILTSSEAYAYKQQLEVIREQMQVLEERGVYNIAGNTIQPEDREEFRELKKMEHHIRQLAAGIEKPSPYRKPKRPGEPPRQRAASKDVARLASEALGKLRGCMDTRNGKESRDGTVAAQETHVAGGD